MVDARNLTFAIVNQKVDDPTIKASATTGSVIELLNAALFANLLDPEFTVKVKENEYKVKFGYNSFCDTDLMDRTSNLIKLFSGADAEDDKDVIGLGKIKELFVCVRDLLFVGFQKYNPVETVQEIGEILDDYREESTDENPKGLLELFTSLTKELMDEGFLGDMLKAMKQTVEDAEQSKNVTPMDHQRPKTKK